MFRVVLANLSADARAVAPLAHHEVRDMPAGNLQALLENFCAIDPIENAVADTEIRVQVRSDSFLLRTERKKIILYDAQRRDLAGQILTVARAMEELDGSAARARAEAILQARGATEPAPTGPELPAPAPPAAASKARLLALSVAAAGLLAALFQVASPGKAAGLPAGFVPLAPAELAERQAQLAGVYLTGNAPGQHGIVVADPAQLKLFELGTVEAPRIIYAAYQLGRVGGKLGFATDQPGGVIAVTAGGQLVYCGETYQRIP